MPYTSPPRPVDLTAIVPGLAEYARTATRLHPRPGSPSVHQSSVGGPLLWPADEPWPHCPGDHWDADQDGPDPMPLLPIAQVYLRDAPSLPHPDGVDLMQLMWCPTQELTSNDGTADGLVQVFWRRAVDIVDVLMDPPTPPRIFVFPGHVPNACIVHPEEVVEYPTHSWMPPALSDQVEAWEESFGDDERPYWYSELAVARGVKVGGWAAPETFWGPAGFGYFKCPCGAPQEALISFDHEWDGDTTWRPIEDNHDDSYEYRKASQMATGLEIGRGYMLQTYYCTKSWDHPIARYMQ